MKITGILAEKGLQALNAGQVNISASCMPRVWIVVADKGEIEIWGKCCQGFDIIACAKPETIGNIEDFTRKFSEWLLTARDQDVLDRVILVAPDEILHTFHSYMPTDVVACIAAEIPQNLSVLPKDARKEALEKMIF